MEQRRGENILVWCEGVFTYALENVKLKNLANFCNEHSLNFGDPSDLSWIYFVSCSAVIILLAGLADSVFGKFYTSCFGLFVLLFSSFFAFFAQSTITVYTSFILVLVYMCTSPMRSALVLEQVRIPSDIDHVRSYIALLVYLKVVSMFLSRISFQYLTGVLSDVNFNISFGIIFIYFGIFICVFGVVFRIESIYFGIWYYIVKLIVLKAKNAREKDAAKANKKLDKKLSVKSILSLTQEKSRISFDNPDHLDEPPADKSFWGLRLILREPEEPLVISTKEEEAKEKPPENESLLSTIQGYIWRFFYAEPAKPVEEEVKPEIIPKGPQKKVTPKKYLTFQLSRFGLILPLLLAVSSFSMLDHVITEISIIQSNIFVREKNYFVHYLDVLLYNGAFDTILFLIFELLIFPVMHKTFRRDLSFFLIGYAFLLLAAVLMIAFQFEATSGREYLPGPRSAQLRIFNGLPKDVAISSVWLKKTLRLSPLDHLDIHDIHISEDELKEMRIAESESKNSITVEVELIQGRTTSYAIVPNGKGNNTFSLMYSGAPDPTAFGKVDDIVLTSYYVISALYPSHNLIQIRFSTIDNSIGKSIVQPINKSDTYTIEAGLYYMNITTDSERVIKVMQTSQHVEFVANGVYSVFIYHNESAIDGRVILVEEPVPITYSGVLMQLFLASVGRAFATVSYYRFLYLESPQKLRSTVFSVPVVLNLIWMAVLDGVLVKRYAHGVHNRLIIIITAIHGFLFFVWIFLANKFVYRFMGYKINE